MALMATEQERGKTYRTTMEPHCTVECGVVADPPSCILCYPCCSSEMHLCNCRCGRLQRSVVPASTYLLDGKGKRFPYFNRGKFLSSCTSLAPHSHCCFFFFLSLASLHSPQTRWRCWLCYICVEEYSASVDSAFPSSHIDSSPHSPMANTKASLSSSCVSPFFLHTRFGMKTFFVSIVIFSF